MVFSPMHSYEPGTFRFQTCRGMMNTEERLSDYLHRSHFIKISLGNLILETMISFNKKTHIWYETLNIKK